MNMPKIIRIAKTLAMVMIVWEIVWTLLYAWAGDYSRSFYMVVTGLAWIGSWVAWDIVGDQQSIIRGYKDLCTAIMQNAQDIDPEGWKRE